MAARYTAISLSTISHALALHLPSRYQQSTTSPLSSCFSIFARCLSTTPCQSILSLSISLSVSFSIYLVPSFSFQPSSLSLSLPVAKQIAKYPQVVDFSDYVLRIAYHRTCQDEYRQSRTECKWSVCWGENDGDFDGSLSYIVTLRYEDTFTEILPSNRFSVLPPRLEIAYRLDWSNVQLSDVQLLSRLQCLVSCLLHFSTFCQNSKFQIHSRIRVFVFVVPVRTGSSRMRSDVRCWTCKLIVQRVSQYLQYSTYMMLYMLDLREVISILK